MKKGVYVIRYGVAGSGGGDKHVLSACLIDALGEAQELVFKNKIPDDYRIVISRIAEVEL